MTFTWQESHSGSHHRKEVPHPVIFTNSICSAEGYEVTSITKLTDNSHLWPEGTQQVWPTEWRWMCFPINGSLVCPPLWNTHKEEKQGVWVAEPNSIIYRCGFLNLYDNGAPPLRPAKKENKQQGVWKEGWSLVSEKRGGPWSVKRGVVLGQWKEGWSLVSEELSLVSQKRGGP